MAHKGKYTKKELARLKKKKIKPGSKKAHAEFRFKGKKVY